MVRWLVDHGARVDNDGEEKVNDNTPGPRPLLETCAMVGSLSTFMFLQNCGAKLSRRTLHLTASAGAFIGADPGNLLSAEVRYAAAKEDDEVIESRRNVEDILRYLVGDMKLDVNALDTDVPKGIHYCGTPLNYAAKEKRGAGVVRWLLENGADSAIKSLGGDGNPGMDGVHSCTGGFEGFKAIFIALLCITKTYRHSGINFASTIHSGSARNLQVYHGEAEY